MVDLVPYLIIHSPSGQQTTFELRDIGYSIGRLPDNDIALIEDPDYQITQGYFILKMVLRVSSPNWQSRWA
ncbi:MAG: hypothetical protein ACLFQ7_17110 [Phormidium sp.]